MPMASGVASTILARLDPSLLSEQVLWREQAARHRRESTRVADREEQTERAASGYAHAQGTDALKADTQDGGAVLTDDLRAWHAMCVVVEAQELPLSARCMKSEGTKVSTRPVHRTWRARLMISDDLPTC